MASPFSIFRKNQKLMLALLTILAMFGFVFLPIIMEQMGSRASRNPVVVKTSKFGDLREYDVDSLRRQRQKILGVLTDVMQMSGAPASLARQYLESRIGPASEESVVNGWLLARHAEQMGMVVGNKTINDFLKGLTQDLVKANNFQTAFKRSGISELQFFGAMRDEMLAMQLDSLFRVSLMGITPAERWDYFTRVKQQATIEAAPVNVTNYLDRIDQPSDEDLLAFFEKHKDQYPMPDSPEPGFREPQKIAMEYFKADFEKFAAAAKVTDEEIKERYEKNKDRYDPPAKKSEEGKEADVSTKDAKDSKETNKGPDAKAPVKTDKQEKAKDSSKDAKEPVKAEKANKSKDSSDAGRPSPFMLTALLQEKSADKPESPKKEEKPAPADKAAPVGPTPQAKPATPPPVADKAVPPAANKAAPIAPTPEAKLATPPPAAQEKPAEPKRGLSEATKERIRREIVYEKIQKVFAGLREQMDEYRRERSKYDVAVIQQRDKQEKTLPPQPPKLDFENLAKANGLSSGRTPLLSQWEAKGSDIGDSLVGSRDPVWHYAFLTLAKFRPEMSVDLKGDLYLFWKTDDTKERIPKFTDDGVRERVLREWKMIRAQKLAMTEAESLAAEAQKSKKFLKQAFAGRPNLHVVLPTPFSWITFGNVPLGSAPGAARISSVAGIDFAGEEFMRTVFHLEPGQTGVAFNASKTVAYVIRLTALSPSDDVLWKQFEVDDFSKYAPAAQSDRQQILHAWLEEIKKSAGVDWKRKPDQMTDSGPRGEE